MKQGNKISKFHFECINCKKLYDHTEVRYLCPDCSISNTAILPPKGVLKTVYDYPEIAKKIFDLPSYSTEGILSLLPINHLSSLPNLRVGDTPLYDIHQLDNQRLPFTLLLKDDAQNPTFSFKDRGSSIVSAYAKENGLETIIAASTGNAGSSIAGMCAAQGLKAIVLVPEKAPKAKLLQIAMYGAQLIPVKGTYDGAFELSIAASKTFGWYNRNTAYNPLTIEGKKTVSFELFQQLKGQMPDHIFIPVGDGVILSGVYKGFEDLLQLGLIEKVPVIVGVQSEGSDNLARNIGKITFEAKDSQTIADSISVDVPRNFFMAQDFIQKYKGAVIAISDSDIMEASKFLARHTGIFTEPASAAAFGGFLQYQAENKLPEGSQNVVLLTGSGLKDLGAVSSRTRIRKPSILTLIN